MRKRLIFAAVYSCIVPQAGATCAAELHAQLFPLTGEVRLANRGNAAVSLVFYSITSAADALDGSGTVWRSISDFYDASGNGFIDPSHNWTPLSATSDELAEAVFSGPGGSLPAMRAISLGPIWDVSASPFPDLAFDIRQPDQQPIALVIDLALDGDYSGNGVVDAADYVQWRRHFGSGAFVADGNLDGIVDAADYDVWRENFGVTLPLPPYASASAGSHAMTGVGTNAIPEPATAVLLLVATTAAAIARAGGRLAAPRAAHRRTARR